MNKQRDTNIEEINTFLALILLQGIVQKPELEMFWSTWPLLDTPYIRQVMTGQRFSSLLRCLHSVTNTLVSQDLRKAGKSFVKIKRAFDFLIDKFSAIYKPITADESSMLFMGRLATKQYIEAKTCKFDDSCVR